MTAEEDASTPAWESVRVRLPPAFERDLIAAWSEHSAIPDWGAFVLDAVGNLARWMKAAT